MSNYARVNVKFGADISEFSTAMQNAARDMQKAGDQLQAVGKSLTMNLTAPIVALGAAALYSYGEIDALKRGLTTFAGSAAAAETEFNKLKEVAKLPGIGLEEAVRGSNNLQAIGLDADYAREAMQAFGNAIATVGGGRQNFDLAIRGFGQLANASKPLQQDLYQIANQLPQVNKIMKDTFGTNRAEDLAKLGMSGKDLADFLVKELGKIPPMAGGIKNAFENMGDSVKVSLASLGEDIEKTFNISGKINALSEILSGLVESFRNLSPPMKTAILAVSAFAAAIGPLSFAIGTIIKLWPTFLAGFSVVSNAIPILKALSIAIGLVTIAWSYFGKDSTETKAKTDNLSLSIAKETAEVSNLFDKLKSTNGASKYRSQLISEINSKYGTTLKNIGDETAFLNQVERAYDGIIKKMKDKIILDAAKSDLEASIKKELELSEQSAQAKLDEVAAQKAVNAANEAGATAGEVSNMEVFKLTQKRLDLEYQITKERENQRNIIKKGGSALFEKQTPTSPSGGTKNQPIANAVKEEAKELEVGYEYMNQVAKQGVEGVEHTFSEASVTIPDRIATMAANSIAALEKWKEQVKAFNEQIALELRAGLNDQIYSIFDQLGTNLGNQEDPLKDIGKRMLESVAGFLQKMGSLWIAYGTAQALIQTQIANPYVAIAAGAAMVAAGAAIKATQNKGLQSAGSYGSNSGGSYSSGGGGQDLTLTTRLDGRDLVLSGQRTAAVTRR